jgi:oligopeptide/dipeptide ABC transporter ATP-binding protein
MPETDHPLLEIKDLSVSFHTEQGHVRVVEHLSLEINRGEVVGLVGESGCGKSVTAMSILSLIPQPPGSIDSGSILFRGHDLLTLSPDERRALRGQSISMIFQEPMTALSPLHRIGKQLAEAVRLHTIVSRKQAREIAIDWLRKVGIPDPTQALLAFPHELSGGMRQRVMIAMALILKPALIIADEPTTALDVTVQAQILELMRTMRGDDTSILLITHDMGVIRDMCSRVMVMYAGHIVETGTVEQIYTDAMHPYTRALLATIPRLDGPRHRLPAIRGHVPSPANRPRGCPFHTRCKHTFERCRCDLPQLYTHGSRSARCFLAEENP